MDGSDVLSGETATGNTCTSDWDDTDY
jgi:hypothetical protein